MQRTELARWMRVEIWWASNGGTVWGGTPDRRVWLVGWVVNEEPQAKCRSGGARWRRRKVRAGRREVGGKTLCRTTAGTPKEIAS